MNLSFDDKLVNGFLKHDSKVLLKIYEECYPMVEKMVVNSGGFRVHAEDIFQEAMIIAYRRIESGKFELKCKFSTYLYAVSKRLWIQEKRKKNGSSVSIEESGDMVEDNAFYDSYDEQVSGIIIRHFLDLSKDCQKILQMHFNKVTPADIQKVMGYRTLHHAIDRKYRCKRSLIKRIINDPKFKLIKNEYSGEIRSIP